MKCFNCGCTQTPLWRRGPGGEQLCNACGIYYKNHGTHRRMPFKMKTASAAKKNAQGSSKASRSAATADVKKKRKQRPKHNRVDLYDVVSGLPFGQDSEVFAAHVLIKLSYDVYMRTPKPEPGHSHHHTMPAYVASHVTRSGVTSPYE